MTALFEVKMIQAAHGDAILVSYGDTSIRHILVDGGPPSALPQLLDVLTMTRRNGELTLEAIVVTHYDVDHIGGITALLQHQPEWLHINDVWFNAHQHMLPRDMLGTKHSDRLAALIVEKNLPWNEAFHRRAVVVDQRNQICLPDGMVVKVVSPTIDILAALSQQWPAETTDDVALPSRDMLGRSDGWPPPPFSGLIGRRSPADSSLSNAASIALILEFAGKRALLTGDSHPEVINASIAALWPCQRPQIDLLKLSHHGSQCNTTSALLQRLSCQRFAISTDGKRHGHPDQILIARLINAATNPEIIFNYRNKYTAQWAEAPPDWPRYRTQYPVGDRPYVCISV